MNDEELSALLAGYLESAEVGHNLAEGPGSGSKEAAEVMELANLANELRSIPPVSPSAAFRSQARRRLLAQLAPRLPWHERLLKPLLTPLKEATAAVAGALWPRRPALVWLLILLFVFVAGGTVYSAEAALPGEALYPVKTSAESLRLSMARDEIRASELHLLFANRRVNEMARLAEEGRAEPIHLATRNYIQHVAKVHDTLQTYEYAGLLVYAFHEGITGQELALAQVSVAVPASARLDIDRAMAVATDSRMAAQELMIAAAPDVVAIMDLRLQFAGERLTAVSTLITLGRVDLTESAMHEYSKQVDEAVSLVVTSGAAVEADLASMVAQRLAIHETVLSRVEAGAPASALPAIQRAQAASAHGRNVVNAIMEGRSKPLPRPVEPPGQASPGAGPPAEVPGAFHTPGAGAADDATTTPPGGGPPFWVTPGQGNQGQGNQGQGNQGQGNQGQGNQGQGNQGQGPSKGKQGKDKGSQGYPELDEGIQEQGSQGQSNGAQGPGNQGQGNQEPGNQGQGNQEPGNQGQGNQEPGNQGQGNQGQGNQGNPPGRSQGRNTP
jgi:hypothetical protein